MSEPFIAPEGAMQFEVLRGWDGGEVPEKFKPYLLWVVPASKPIQRKSLKADCPHPLGYDVICHNRQYIVGRPGAQRRVCECVGHLIE